MWTWRPAGSGASRSSNAGLLQPARWPEPALCMMLAAAQPAPGGGALPPGGVKDGLVGSELFGKTVASWAGGAIGPDHRGPCATPSAAGSSPTTPGPSRRPILSSGCPLSRCCPGGYPVAALPAQRAPAGDRRGRSRVMKPTAIIRTARARWWTAQALAEALNAGRLAGAGVDVFGAGAAPGREPSAARPRTPSLRPTWPSPPEQSMLLRAQIVFDT